MNAMEDYDDLENALFNKNSKEKNSKNELKKKVMFTGIIFKMIIFICLA